MKFTKFTNAMHKEEGGTRESLHSARAEKKNALSHVLNPSYRPHVKPLPKHAPVILRYFGFFYSTNRNRGLPGGAKERKQSKARKQAVLVGAPKPTGRG